MSLWRRGASVCFVLAAASQTVVRAQEPPQGATHRVEVTLDRQSARIGERVLASLTLVGAPVIAARPRLGTHVGDFEVVVVKAERPKPSGTPWSQSWTIALIAFEAGSLTVGGMAVEGELVDGQTFVTSPTRPILVRIDAPNVGPDDQLRPLTAPLTGPEPPAWHRAMMWALIVGCLGGFIVLAATRFRVRYTERSSNERFWRRLDLELSRLSEDAPIDVPTARESYKRAAFLLREGIEHVLRRRLQPLSSSDVARIVASSGAWGEKAAPELKRVLSAVDEVRFGGIVPHATHHKEVFAGAHSVLRTVGRGLRKPQGQAV